MSETVDDKAAPAAIAVYNLCKRFDVPVERTHSLKGSVINALRGRGGRRRLLALDDVSFEVAQGEFFGIVGANGSGKSTLLKLLAGIYVPTSGTIDVHGNLSPFIELGVGFNPDLTARENVFLNGTILGLSRDELRARFDEIIGFAELEDFVDQRLKNFSSGMLVRLAFSIAIRAHAEVLLVDEVLAVGDANFQQKCFDQFRRLKAEGRTIVFVSHDLHAVRQFCDRVLVLSKGRSYGIHTAEEALAQYSLLDQRRAHAELLRREGRSAADVDSELAEMPEHPAWVEQVELRSANGSPTRALHSGEDMLVEIAIQNPRRLRLAVGAAIYRQDGLYCFGTNTHAADTPIGDAPEITASAVFKDIPLGEGTYRLAIGVFDEATTATYDMRESVLEFRILGVKGFDGAMHLPHRWSTKDASTDSPESECGSSVSTAQTAGSL